MTAKFSKVGVVGCGLMGSGIAQVCAESGYKTTVVEVNEELLQKGFSRIESGLQKAVERNKITESRKSEIMANLSGSTQLESLKDSDIIIEAIVENVEQKKQLYQLLDDICPPHTIFASNTSSIPIIEMAAATKRPDRFVGLHFFNPVPVMKLVEVVRSIATSDQTVEDAKQFGESLGKRPIIAKDRPGFIVNVLLIPYLLDAIRLLEAGVATKEDIDAGMTLGCNHPMGPLTLADFVGLDTTYYIAKIMYEEFKDPRYAPPILLKQMVTAGYLGRKSGRGFYEYDSGS